MRLYTMWDITAESCGRIFESKNDGIALRNFQIFMEREDNLTAQDQELYYLGDFNHETMTLKTSTPTKVVPKLSHIKEIEEEDANI